MDRLLVNSILDNKARVKVKEHNRVIQLLRKPQLQLDTVLDTVQVMVQVTPLLKPQLLQAMVKVVTWEHLGIEHLNMEEAKED